MIIKTKIRFKEYVKLLYSLAYERTMLRLLVLVALLLLLWILFYNFDVFNLPKPIIYQYITLSLIAIAQPAIIFITIWRNYYSSNQLRETLEIELANEMIKINGESYYMEIEWEKLFKIVEKPNWFLMYQNNLSAIIIPKKDMDEKDIDKFRKLLSGLKVVPVELLK
ncbi:YcxB family protein [Flavobacterium psychraquaticum]|uniref:YcxB family protein n=1 Tax=Flavobacterium psychraquaticum TaxID=3103958 RepID=UPI002ACECB4C|nr:YcxB family protein [Flavobacterium sp. LB-N7T]